MPDCGARRYTGDTGNRYFRLGCGNGAFDLKIFNDTGKPAEETYTVCFARLDIKPGNGMVAAFQRSPEISAVVAYRSESKIIKVNIIFN